VGCRKQLRAPLTTLYRKGKVKKRLAVGVVGIGRPKVVGGGGGRNRVFDNAFSTRKMFIKINPFFFDL